VVPEEELDGACDALVGRLARLPRTATAGTKRLLGDSWRSSLRDALTAETDNQLRVIESPEATEAIAAFLTKSERKG
jgi:enoyl-CoA hydratase/carnithine racemase